MGKILALFLGPLSVMDSNEAEIRVIAYVSGLFMSSYCKTLRSLVVEWDSLIVLGWVTQSEHMPWKCKMFFAIYFVCSDLGYVCFVHAFRETNGMANALAMLRSCSRVWAICYISIGNCSLCYVSRAGLVFDFVFVAWFYY
ncbi:hypothetical protein GQ457_16G017250 [Hibiscus cannabinus]